MVPEIYILSLESFGVFFIFTEEIAFKYLLFTNITKFKFFSVMTQILKK